MKKIKNFKKILSSFYFKKIIYQFNISIIFYEIKNEIFNDNILKNSKFFCSKKVFEIANIHKFSFNLFNSLIVLKKLEKINQLLLNFQNFLSILKPCLIFYFKYLIFKIKNYFNFFNIITLLKKFLDLIYYCIYIYFKYLINFNNFLKFFIKIK